MFCKYCGSQLLEDAKFCSSCGNKVETVEPVKEAPALNDSVTVENIPVVDLTPVAEQTPEPAATVTTDVNDDLSGKQSSVLTFGILGLALAVSTVLSFLGIIFGAMAMNKAKEYIALTGQSPARVSVGKGLGKAGLISGIAMTAFWTLYFSVIIIISILTASF